MANRYRARTGQEPGEAYTSAARHPPLPDLLFDSEVDKLLAAASNDPRTYLLILLLLETGMKKAELLRIGHG